MYANVLSLFLLDLKIVMAQCDIFQCDFTQANINVIWSTKRLAAEIHFVLVSTTHGSRMSSEAKVKCLPAHDIYIHRSTHNTHSIVQVGLETNLQPAICVCRHLLGQNTNYAHSPDSIPHFETRSPLLDFTTSFSSHDTNSPRQHIQPCVFPTSTPQPSPIPPPPKSSKESKPVVPHDPSKLSTSPSSTRPTSPTAGTPSSALFAQRPPSQTMFAKSQFAASRS